MGNVDGVDRQSADCCLVLKSADCSTYAIEPGIDSHISYLQ